MGCVAFNLGLLLATHTLPEGNTWSPKTLGGSALSAVTLRLSEWLAGAGWQTVTHGGPSGDPATAELRSAVCKATLGSRSALQTDASAPAAAPPRARLSLPTSDATRLRPDGPRRVALCVCAVCTRARDTGVCVHRGRGSPGSPARGGLAAAPSWRARPGLQQLLGRRCQPRRERGTRSPPGL